MKRFMATIILSAACLSLVFGQAGTRLVGFDAQSVGRGGTSIGTFDSPELLMTNPAGISFLDGRMVSLDVSLMFPTLHFKNALNDKDGDKNIFPLPALGYVDKLDDTGLSWGVGFSTTGGMGADFNMRHALYRDQSGAYIPQEYHSQIALMQGGLSVAYMVNERLSVGASAHLAYSMLEFGMPFSLDPLIMQGIAMPGMTFGMLFSAPPASGGFGYDEVTATASMTDLTAIGFNGKLGIAYLVNDALSLGVSYTMPIPLTYGGGKATMDMTQQLNDAFGKAVQGYLAQNPGATLAAAQTAVTTQFTSMGINLAAGVKANYDLDVELTFPQSVGFGVSYKPLRNVRLSADAEWTNWESAFDQMTLKLTNGSNANINTMLGNTGAFDIAFPLKWKNAILIKVGGEYDVNRDLTVRAGFANGANPVPQSTLFPVFPAIVENHVMLGASYQVIDRLTIHAAVEMGLNNSVTASNPSLIANEYDGGTSELSTQLIHLSFSYGF